VPRPGVFAYYAALLATAQRLDATVTRLLSDVRMLHEQIERIGEGRVRRLEEKAAS
jgi:hypothetical protein